MLERIAIDAVVADRDVAEPLQLGDRGGGDAAIGEVGRRHAAGRALQHMQRIVLLLAQGPANRLRRGCVGRQAGRHLACCSVRLQPVHARRGERHHPHGLESVHPRGQPVRRQRRGERRAGSGQVVVGHPLRELDHVRRHERVRVHHLDDVLQREPGVGGADLPDGDAGDLARAKRHHHARAGHGHGLIGRDAISEQAERGHRHRDGHETIAHGVPTGRPGGWRGPSSCLPTLRASPTGCAAGRRDERSGSRWCRDSRRSARAAV